MKTDFQRLFRSIGDVIVEALRPVTAKLAELEARGPEKGDPGDRGRDGVDGKDGSPGRDGVDGKDGLPGKDGVDGKDGSPGNDGQHGSDGSDGVAGKDGADGRHGNDGKDGAAGLDGKDGAAGKDGRDGIDGKAGIDGKDGATGADGGAGKDGLAGKDGRDGVDGKDGAYGQDGADGTAGADGRDGLDGKDGRDGVDGKDGKDGEPGIAGRSVTMDDVMPVLDGALAKWMLEVERRIMDMAQRAVESMPRPKDGVNGVDGKDGMSADEFLFDFDLERREFTATRKGVILFKNRIPFPKYIDVWTEKFGKYEEGFIVTFGGHGWIAKRDTEAKPGTDDSWQLFVKKGRDGK